MQKHFSAHTRAKQLPAHHPNQLPLPGIEVLPDDDLAPLSLFDLLFVSLGKRVQRHPLITALIYVTILIVFAVAYLGQGVTK